MYVLYSFVCTLRTLSSSGFFFLLLKVVQRLKLKTCRTRFTFYAIIIMNLRIYAFISLLEIYINSVQKIALYVIRDKKRQLDCSMSSALFYETRLISRIQIYIFLAGLKKIPPTSKLKVRRQLCMYSWSDD